MYSILMDTRTRSFFMEPGEVAFHAYSDFSNVDFKKSFSRLVETDMDDIKEFETMCYNAGFFTGYMDGKPYRISKQSIYYYDRNPNEISYAQYILTKDKKYLELIKKQHLITLCKLNDTSVYFPTVTLSDGTNAVLTYTSKSRIPQELFEKYDGWKCVKMTYDARCLVNGSFVAQ